MRWCTVCPKFVLLIAVDWIRVQLTLPTTSCCLTPPLTPQFLHFESKFSIENWEWVSQRIKVWFFVVWHEPPRTLTRIQELTRIVGSNKARTTASGTRGPKLGEDTDMDTFLINNEYFVSGSRVVTLNCHDPIGYLHMDTFFIFLYKVRRLGGVFGLKKME